MKSSVKREKKKYPYNRMKQPIFAQIRAMEKRKQLKLPMYTIIDNKGNVIEKYRLRLTARHELERLQKEYYVKLKIVELDEYGKPVVPAKR